MKNISVKRGKHCPIEQIDRIWLKRIVGMFPSENNCGSPIGAPTQSFFAGKLSQRWCFPRYEYLNVGKRNQPNT